MKKENSHKKAGGFHVPKDYFEDFEDNLFGKIAEKSLPESDGYRIPKDYFEDFEARLFQKLHPEKETKVIKLATYKKVYYTLGSVAAALVLFIAVKNLVSSPVIINGPSVVEIEAYIDNGYMILDSYDIAEVFNDEIATIETMPEYNIDDENLLDYLDENLEDYNDLIIEN